MFGDGSKDHAPDQRGQWYCPDRQANETKFAARNSVPARTKFWERPLWFGCHMTNHLADNQTANTSGILRRVLWAVLRGTVCGLVGEGVEFMILPGAPKGIVPQSVLQRRFI